MNRRGRQHFVGQVTKLKRGGSGRRKHTTVYAGHSSPCVAMDKEEYDKRQEEIARFAESEGAWYFDPESPVIWKRYIIGPVPIWRRVLWWWARGRCNVQ